MIATTCVLWWQMPYSEKGTFPRFTLVFWFSGCWMFFPLFQNLFTFSAVEVPLRKELSGGAYRLSAFFLTHTTMLFVKDLVWIWLYVPIVFVATHFGVSFWVGGELFLAIILEIFTMQSISFVVGTLFAPSRVATVAIVLMTFFFAFGGVLRPLTELPEGFHWLEHVNIMAYQVHLYGLIIFNAGTTFTCADANSAFDICNRDTRVGLLSNSTLLPVEQTLRIISHEDVLEQFGLWRSSWLCLVVLFGTSLICRVLAFFLLKHHLASDTITHCLDEHRKTQKPVDGKVELADHEPADTHVSEPLVSAEASTQS
mmetsp:Transcript_23213/g.32798  ORF Transcript_23213/g.32798 Transcript_23213/m.32798 type:complete len:313 (-) Transcript_23213:66-1004(-)